MRYVNLLGAYLLVHFIQLLPDAELLFSNQGFIKDKTLLPTYGILPNILFQYDSPEFVKGFIVSMAVASFILMSGYKTRLTSAWLFYGWYCLFNRNIFINNPSLAFIGWILLALTIDPVRKSRMLRVGAWVITGASYTASGIHKLQCQSWLDGSALREVLSGLLARETFILRFLLDLPPQYLQYMTWISLFAEISFLFLGLFKRSRRRYWVFIMMFHIGILTTINFADLTFGMIVAHCYLFSEKWINPNAVIKPILNNNAGINANNNASTEQINNSEYINARISTTLVAIVAVFLGVYTYYNANILYKFNEVVIDSMWGFGFLIIALGFIMIMERLFPSQPLNNVPGWWVYVLLINVFQLFAVILATLTWEKWLQQTDYYTNIDGFHLKDYVSPFIGAIIAYVLNQWVFYWWHYMRHHIYVFWILFHQFHHSPTRIEAITSFYKHPLEIVVDSQIMAVLVYAILGLTHESSIWLSVFSGVGEYIYHMNLNTPKLMGYFFQRPESHRMHHNINARINCPNYSDLPVFDMLNETFKNPDHMDDGSGFPQMETRRLDMLFFKDILKPKKIGANIKNSLVISLIAWGLFSTGAFFVHSNYQKALIPFVSSPLPLVFTSYNGVETFSLFHEIHLKYETPANTTIAKLVDRKSYNAIQGSYNKRNVYGVLFSYGPLMTDTNLIKLRDHILYNILYDPRNPDFIQFNITRTGLKKIIIKTVTKNNKVYYTDVSNKV